MIRVGPLMNMKIELLRRGRETERERDPAGERTFRKTTIVYKTLTN